MPLEPFLVHSPAGISEEERKDALHSYECFLENLESRAPITYPSTDQFMGITGTDCSGRWMVEVRQAKESDEQYRQKVPAEAERLRELERAGKLLFSSVA